MNRGGMASGIHDSCESLLQAMVGFDTVNTAISGKPHAERALSVYMEGQALAMGLDTRRLPVTGDGFNLLISRQVDSGAPWLLFESHLDTVSVDGMTVDPFEGRVVDGRMYGRGTCDTKGTGAAMLWALSRSSERIGPNNVAILYTLDEEVGKTGVRTFVASQMPEMDWRPAGVIVGEPTRLRAVVAHNGVVRWRIRTEGVAVHSSDPARGRSAIRTMTEVIGALEERYISQLTSEHPLTGAAQCSINLIRGGTQINMIPEHCEIHVDRRVVPGEDPDTVIPAVERILEELRADNPDLTVVQETPDMVDSPLDPAGGKAFGAFVASVLKSMGLPDGLTGVGYGTDASSFSRAGIPTIVLGPGDIAQGHTADEWIDLGQLNSGVDVYYNLMCSPVTGQATP